jgi:hypothetical protein
MSDKESIAELRASLLETREACAAALRVIAKNNLADEFETEFMLAGVANGFGKRADTLIRKHAPGDIR